MVAVTGRCVDEPLYPSALLLAFVCATMTLNSEHVHNRHTRGEGKVGGVDNQAMLLL